MSRVAQALGVSRSNLIEQVNKPANRRQSYHRTSDDEALAWIKPVVDKRPTYGYRRVTAVVNRLRRADGLGHLNHKRVYRIMKRHNLLLAKHSVQR